MSTHSFDAGNARSKKQAATRLRAFARSKWWQRQKSRHEIIQSWFRNEMEKHKSTTVSGETIAVHNLYTKATATTTNWLCMYTRRRASYTWQNEEKTEVMVVCTSRNWSREAPVGNCVCNTLRIEMFQPGRWNETRKGFFSSSHVRNCCFMKPKKKKEKRKERTYYCHCCRAVL